MPTTTDRRTAGAATERWKAAVARHVESGLSRSAATAKVAAADPQLHADYVAEFNGKATAEQPTNPKAIADWTALVDENVARGMSRTKAVNAAAAQNPELHAAYLREYNSQHGRR